MKSKHIVMLTLGLCCTSLSFAGDVNTWKKMGTLSLGPAWSAPGSTQVIAVQPELVEAFVAKSATQTFGDGEIFLGLQHHLQDNLQVQLGVAAAATTPISLHGDVWQDADPDFNNLFYQYKIAHSHVAAKGKLLTEAYQLVQPYLSGSVGVGFNHAYQYSSTSKLFEVLPEPSFAQHTTTAFTYTVGVGVQRAINNQWYIGLGYEFADWGKTALAGATGQLLNTGVNLNHVYTNELQFSLSFVL